MSQPAEKGLGHYMQLAGMNDPALASLAGTSKQQIFKLRKGQRKLDKEWAGKLAPHLGVTPAVLMGFADTSEGPTAREPFSPGTVPKDRLVVREYLADIAAGPGSEPPLDWRGQAEVVAEWILPRDFLPPEHRHATVAVVRVRGDSMAPSLRPHDRVMVDISHDYLGPDGAYLAWNGMGVVFKRLQAIPGKPPKVRFSSDNPAYEAYMVPADEVRVFGKIIGKWDWW